MPAGRHTVLYNHNRMQYLPAILFYFLEKQNPEPGRCLKQFLNYKKMWVPLY